MAQQFKNNARSLLTASITNTATTIVIEATKADLFPIANVGTGSLPSTSDWFKVTLQDPVGNVEIVAVRTRTAGSGILSNVIRGYDGTTPLAFVSGTVVGLRITAEDVQTALDLPNQNSVFTGDNSFSGTNEFTGTQTFSGVTSFSDDVTFNDGATGNLTGNVTGNAGTVTNGVYTTGNQTIGGVKTFSSTIAGNAATATLATKASTLAQNGANGAAMTFNWSGLGGQPTWLWGGTDGANMYVYNPSNFSVSYASTAGSASSASELIQYQYAGPYFYGSGSASNPSVTTGGFSRLTGRMRTSIAGSVRVALSGGFGDFYYPTSGWFRLYRNGVAVTGDLYWPNQNTTWQGDFTCSVGDTFEVYARSQYGGTNAFATIKGGFSDVFYRVPVIYWGY